MTKFCITVRFLHSAVHGRADGGEPEWPPSPLRLFQSLVAASAGRWNERQLLGYAVPALKGLESLCPPEIVSPGAVVSDVRTQFYVPDNTADLSVAAWKKGDDKPIKRTEKVVRPTHLGGDALHYLFPVTPEAEQHLEVLRAAARSITHLGWGVDMVAGDARVISEEEAAKLPGHRWRPVPTGGTPLRVPRTGTLDDLIRKHAAFLNRLDGDGFRPVPPLSCFEIIGYSSPTVSKPAEARCFAAFQILDPMGERYKAFNTPRRTRDVAAWIRHATGIVCEGWPFGDTAGFVHGHNSDGKQAKGEAADRRFQYLPLPSIERRPDGNVTGSIRRIMIAAPHGFQDRLDYIRRRLPGQELTWDGNTVGLLNLLPTSDWVLKRYVGTSHTWSTVTPVIWPGYDDRDSAKAEKLLRKAIADAGIPKELVDSIEAPEWRQVGFQAGVDLARNFARPNHLSGSMYHVRIRFAQPIRGPLVVGAGRYRGFGLFAIDE